jgi:alpha-L-fucosidase 2
MEKTGFALLILTISLISQTGYPQDKRPEVNQAEMCWWYNSPATKYWEGLPVGTGRFAAMVSGRTADEVIPFNDETLWTGGPYNPNNPDGPAILQNVRKYIFAKDWVNAQKEAYRLGSDPVSVQCYQPMGRLNLKFEGHDKVENYHRKLSMDSALVTISYTLNNTDYKREIFASYPDQVIVIRLTASKKRSISFSCWLTSLQPSAVTDTDGKDIVMSGSTIDRNIIQGESRNDPVAYRILPPQMKWQSRVKVINEGGTIKTDNDKVYVTNADAVTILLAGATNWKSWNDISINEKGKCNNYISLASRFSYTRLKERHLSDYCPIFSGCKIDLGDSETSRLSTTDRMEKLRAGGDDPLYISQYFHYGRYLLLAGARENTLAFNNHNIWLDDMSGRWRGRWTLNINIQECYWPVESTNLPEVNESLLLFTENLAAAGRRTAKELYGCRGWTAHHGTDIWFNTAPTDGDPVWADFPMAGAWLMLQLFDHYLYDPDINYLKRIYPLLKGAAEFGIDFLVKDPETGWLVTCPSTSPENAFFNDKGERCSVSKGSTIDNAILRSLFRNCILACKVLNTDEAFRKQMEDAISKLPPYQTGKSGQLQEWLYDFKEVEVTHRHLSHLFGVFPDDDITLRKNPELVKAVNVVLQRRGDINTGWSGAWKINLHARLEDPEAAYSILNRMLTEVSLHPRPEDSRITPSFEGNQGIQGVTSGIAEMLMQSQSSEISLLPALPEKWKNGAVEGLRARGGYNVSVFWKNGILKNAYIYSKYDNKCRVRTRVDAKVLSDGKELKINSPEKGVLEFDAKAGKEYEVVRK